MSNSQETTNTVPQPLPERSLLHNRYIVGPVAGKPTPYIINYIGLDNQTKQKVVIRELFPTQFCVRGKDGKDIENKTAGDQLSFQTIKDKFVSQAKQYPVIPHASVHSGVEVFEENGTSYQVTEYVKGIDLPSFLAKRSGHLGEHECLQLFLPLLDGLQQVHEFGLHHGYISPETIRVVQIPDGFRLVLMNLGIPPKSGAKVLPGYTSPEVTSGNAPADKLADIYGIAATLYTVVTGAKPPAATERLQSPALPALSAPDLALSDSMQSGILAGMATNPKDRLHTALNFKLSILGESEDSLIPDQELLEADESLFEGVATDPNALAGGSSSSSKNTRLLIGLIAGTFLVFFLPLWFFIIAPILEFTSATQEAFEDFGMQMEQLDQQQQQPDFTIETEEPTQMDESQMSQREIEVQRLLEQGDGLITMGNMDEGIATIQKAASMTPNNPDVHLSLGRAFVKANKSREAIQAFEKVLRLDPGNGEAYGSLGFIYYDSQRQARAFDHFRKAAALGDQVTISFLQSEANRGNATAQSVLRDNGITW